MARGVYGVGAIAVCLLGLAAACSSSGSSLSADQGCADVADALCQALNSCSAVLIQQTYGDLATCQTRAKASCVGTTTAPGTGVTPTIREDCAKVVGSTSCADLLDNNFPLACRSVTGNLAAGAACGDSSQCQSSYCNLGTDGTCGACGAARATAGGTCLRDDDCDFGLVCGSGTCATPAVTGGSCDDTHPCLKTLVCKSGTCTGPGAAGAACTQGTCDTLAGLYCATGSTDICTKIALANAGEACELVNGTFTLCTAGGLCKLPTGSLMGTCEAPAVDGAACDDTNGPPCLPPATCSSAKVCTVPDPASCH